MPLRSASNEHPQHKLHGESGLPRSGKKVWKMKIFPGQGKVREFWFESGKLEKTDKSQGISIFLKTEMAMAVSLNFRNINLQNWPHSFVK